MTHVEIEPDHLVREALRILRPAPQLTDQDVDRLSARVAAWLPTPRPSWRDEMVRLGRVLAPIALAAGLFAFLLFRGWGGEPRSEANDAFLSALTGQSTSETVLDAALGEQDGAWLLAERR